MALSGPEPSRLLSTSATAPMGTSITCMGGTIGFPGRLGGGSTMRVGGKEGVHEFSVANAFCAGASAYQH